MADYYLSEIAQQDIETIVRYLIDRNYQSAQSFVNRTNEIFMHLAKHPHLGHRRDDLTDQPVRFLTIKWRFLVVYKPSQPVEIVRVLSGYQDIVQLIDASEENNEDM